MAVLLYYPLVKPPTEVLHQALLYWDGIASVVPRDDRVYDVAVPAELNELRDRALYAPLHLDEGSLNVLRRGGPAARVLRQELRRLAARPGPRGPLDARIYCSKLTSWLERELLRQGLAEQSDPGIWTLAVSREVQRLIIGVVARELAAYESWSVSYVPYTDDEDAHTHALRAPAEERLPAWQMELGGLLPVPAPGTPTADVLAFRDRYADERHRLMRALHRLLGDLRRDYEHPADVVSQLRREIDQSVEDYRGAVKSSRMAWVERSVMVTVALGAAAGSMVQPGLTWVLGAVGGYALNVATRDIRPLARTRDGHDFSYLHRVKETLT